MKISRTATTLTTKRSALLKIWAVCLLTRTQKSVNLIKCVQRTCVPTNIQIIIPHHQSSPSHEKDTTSKNNEKMYQFECAYCTYKTDEYNPFMDHINTNHLESDDENDVDDTVKDTQA